MKRFVFFIALILVFLFAQSRITPGVNSAALVKISFFYDTNINGKQDPGEPLLTNVNISVSGYFQKEADGSIRVQKYQTIELRISGSSPNGKPLTNATYQEPFAVIMLPNITYKIGEQDVKLGLADGFLTSPIKPTQMNLEGYKAALKNPAKWKTQTNVLYPRGWHYPRNYFFYGYRIPAGGLAGTPHLAFDIGANPGTAVLASAPGTIVKPLFDWRFGISGAFGTVYYNHIVPAVKIGDKVKRYDIVGYIAEGQGNHVHFELRPDAAKILSAFPNMKEKDFIKSPLNGEPVPLPPCYCP